jgi:hypothetical protein
MNNESYDADREQQMNQPTGNVERYPRNEPDPEEQQRQD